MLRSVIEHDNKSAPAYMKVAAAAKTGMGVVISSGQLAFPSAATADDIYVLNKARVPEGLLAAAEVLSDYEEQFNTFAAGDYAVAENFDFGEQFATDQYNATNLTDANAGKVLVVGTDGKWDLATSTTTSKYIFVGLFNDGSHVLARIRVSDTPVANS